MSENKKQQLVPRLRFPEFFDDQSWSFQSLGRLARRSTKKNTEGDITRVLTNSAEYGVIDQRDFFDKDIANQGNLEGYYIVEEGDYVYNPRISATAPVGPVSKNRVGLGVMSPLYTVFRFNNRHNDFYAHYFRTTHWHRYMRQASSTGARHDRMSITNDDFLGLPLPVPSPAEQQKIAGYLSSLVELIALENQRLETFKRQKNGLLQQLLPEDGEDLPRLRFPGFLEAGVWKKKILGECCIVVRGGSPRPIDSFITNEPEGLNWLKIGDVGKEAKFVTKTAEKVRPEALSKTREVNPGDLILSNSMSFGRPYIMKIKSCIHDGWIAITNLCSEVDRDYIYYMIFSPASQAYFLKNAAGSGVLNLNAEIIRGLPVAFPSLQEQKAIAACLSCLDELIESQVEKIYAMKNILHGLQQRLFPMLDEIVA